MSTDDENGIAILVGALLGIAFLLGFILGALGH